MFQSGRPKFSLDLTIKELSNIPQIKGSCYVDIQIRESPGMKSFPTFKHKTLHHINPGTDGESKSPSQPEESQTSVSSNSISVHTANKHIHNFKCAFNYNLRCNLRFPFNKKENLVGNKYLMMKVYYVDDSHDSNIGHHATELGRLELNLSEYLNFDQATTSKYLLQNSKVNSIMTLVVFLDELPADYNFHTQLQITDNASSATSSRTFTQVNRGATKKKSFNVPQFEKNKVFGGFNGVLGSQTNGKASARSSASETSSVNSDSDEKPERSCRRKSGNRGGESRGGESHKETRSKNEESQVIDKGTFMMDPTISNLYKKILESTWDPELHKLLQFDPEMCIEDIFKNGGNGWNQYLSQNFGTWEGDEHEGDEDYYTVNGLIDEPKYRDDLKSWNVDVNKVLSK